MSDLFNANNAVSVKWAKWDQVGRTYQGVYVEYRQEDSTLTSSGKQHVYVLKEDSGEILYVPFPGGRECKQMQNIPLGAVVGFKFEGELEPTRAGWNKTKQIQVYFAGQKNMQVLHEYQGVSSASVVDEANVVQEPAQEQVATAPPRTEAPLPPM